MSRRPTGTVTFLFTDIEGSTARWEREPEAMQVALARHDALLDAIVAAHDGWVFKTVGDACCAAFARAETAVAAAAAAQRAIASEDWGTGGPDESLAIKRELSDRWGIAATLASLARAALEEGDGETAKAAAAESLQTFDELGDGDGVAMALETIADLALIVGTPARALRLRAAAEALRESVGAPLPPPEKRWRDRTFGEAEQALGIEDASLAINGGTGLDSQAAVAEAMEIVGA